MRVAMASNGIAVNMLLVDNWTSDNTDRILLTASQACSTHHDRSDHVQFIHGAVER